MNILEVKHLTKDYGNKRGVFDVSFTIKKGEVYGFLGPNGAGKSTTIRHLLGFSHPDKGETKILGYNSFFDYSKVLRDVGYIPGEISLPAGLNGIEFIKMMQQMQGKVNEERLNYLLDIFKLTKEQLLVETKRMSLGVKRKLAIVVAFMSDPQVLILDEPTSGLDPMMQEVFIDLIKEEKKRGKTILLSSHIFQEVDATCERIGIIKDGKLVSEFNSSDLKHNKLKRYKLIFKTNRDFKNALTSIENASYINVLNKDDNKKTIQLSCHDDYINSFLEIVSSYQLEDFVNLKETLQDYFMKFYKEDREYGGLN